MTSRAAINRIQRQLPRGTKIGHTGTLDPLATGVLVVCLGQATRLAEYVQAMPKTYRSTFRLASRSDTDDADGNITATPGAKPIALTQIESALRSLLGEIDQVPPAYSAAKIEGRRSYDLAREGEAVNLNPRRITVYDIDLLSYSWPDLEVEILCSKGTYIRSIARDLGERLGCGGYVATLRRTRVGSFGVEDAISIDSDFETIRRKLRPMSEAVAELPRVDVDAKVAEILRFGQTIPFAGAAAEEAAVFHEHVLVAIAAWAGNQLRPMKVFSRRGAP
jgi:tRNA pseudouridine55 synthase